MSTQTYNRGAEFGAESDRVDYQRYEHEELHVLTFAENPSGIDRPDGRLFDASVRIYCPDIRVVSRIAVIFEPFDVSQRALYDLSNIGSTIIAHSGMNARSRIAYVGSIVGKHGVPLAFPKSNIDGFAFQNTDDLPWIQLEMQLGFPGVPGTWTVYYHATSDNKLKRSEWEGYISRVTMNVDQSPGVIGYKPTRPV